MSGAWVSPWPWLGLGAAWWLAGLATALPYRRRHWAWVRMLRPLLGATLVVAGAIEARRSRRSLREGRPFRGQTVLWLALLLSEGVMTLVWGLLSLAGRTP